MAGEYQRIKTPRMYVDLPNWYMHTENKVPDWNLYDLGAGMGSHLPSQWYGNLNTGSYLSGAGYNGVLFDMNPSTYIEINPLNTAISTEQGLEFILPIPDYIPPDSLGNSQFYLALIGHNFKDASFGIQVNHLDTNSSDIPIEGFGKILNGDNGAFIGTNSFLTTSQYSISPSLNGTTIVQLEDLSPSEGADNYIQVRIASGENGSSTFGYLGCLSYGIYYDFPHSPELSVSMGRMYDGIEPAQTTTGHDYINTNFKGSPRWLMHPWDLPDQVFQSYSDGPGENLIYKDFYPTGRRTWTMNFNYLDESDVMPYVDTASHENAFIDAEIGGLISDQASPGQYSLAGHPGFMNQVIQRTYGGNYPLIFQSNKDSMQSDAFSIVKFDAIPEFTQVANGVYSCSLSLREVW